MLERGLKGRAETRVVAENTAIEIGSGSVEVFATPMLVALMEEAAINALRDKLPPGHTTVGTHIDISHLAATPKGMTVQAAAELTEVAGKRLTFQVEAYDSREKVGEGTHRRFLLEQERFMEKVEGKRQGNES